MGNVGDNLLKLQGRLFGQFDDNINPEAGYVMVKIHNELDFGLKLKTHALIELTQMDGPSPTRTLGQSRMPPSCKKLGQKEQSNFMIIWLSDWDTSDDIRKQSANLENLFQLEHGMAWLLHKLLQDELCEPSVKSKASHQRLIHLQTEHLNTAKRLILTRVTVFGRNYEVK
ncbi:hypothetical protein H9Q72_013369 [Fusarium xylarioides]|uniref:Uncharacterized protein n=1 Tax=Fusarium xylarioides TaxID=221167 RepID=A0A9P7KZL0_9HYPO|nr:hypothetical protein H9Q72_013369 [Fusarium xylarioides]